jgi:hypothetical protein
MCRICNPCISDKSWIDTGLDTGIFTEVICHIQVDRHILHISKRPCIVYCICQCTTWICKLMCKIICKGYILDILDILQYAEHLESWPPGWKPHYRIYVDIILSIYREIRKPHFRLLILVHLGIYEYVSEQKLWWHPSWAQFMTFFMIMMSEYVLRQLPLAWQYIMSQWDQQTWTGVLLYHIILFRYIIRIMTLLLSIMTLLLVHHFFFCKCPAWDYYFSLFHYLQRTIISLMALLLFHLILSA